ncbi:MAG: HAMP domain-containing sensor histidine kinase [Pseudomonadota bacterium]
MQERLALAEDLRRADEAHDQAARLAEQRRAAMAYATHDLRQTFTSLWLSLGRMTDLPADERAALRRHFGYLEDLVDRYLDDATDPDQAEEPDPEAAAASGTVETFPAALLLDTVSAMFREEAEAKGLRFRVVPCGRSATADPMAAIRLYANLVFNAVKYTECGGVVIGCRRAGDCLRFAVYDSGPGLTETQIAEIRRPGIQGESSSGKGLGLSVVDELAEAHGLEVSIHSELGCGPCFAFSVLLAGP